MLTNLFSKLSVFFHRRLIQLLVLINGPTLGITSINSLYLEKISHFCQVKFVSAFTGGVGVTLLKKLRFKD